MTFWQEVHECEAAEEELDNAAFFVGQFYINSFISFSTHFHKTTYFLYIADFSFSKATIDYQSYKVIVKLVDYKYLLHLVVTYCKAGRVTWSS